MVIVWKMNTFFSTDITMRIRVTWNSESRRRILQCHLLIKLVIRASGWWSPLSSSGTRWHRVYSCYYFLYVICFSCVLFHLSLPCPTFISLSFFLYFLLNIPDIIFLFSSLTYLCFLFFLPSFFTISIFTFLVSSSIFFPFPFSSILLISIKGRDAKLISMDTYQGAMIFFFSRSALQFLDVHFIFFDVSSNF